MTADYLTFRYFPDHYWSMGYFPYAIQLVQLRIRRKRKLTITFYDLFGGQDAVRAYEQHRGKKRR